MVTGPTITRRAGLEAEVNGRAQRAHQRLPNPRRGRASGNNGRVHGQMLEAVTQLGSLGPRHPGRRLVRIHHLGRGRHLAQASTLRRHVQLPTNSNGNVESVPRPLL